MAPVISVVVISSTSSSSVIVISSSSSSCSAPNNSKHDCKWCGLMKRRTAFKRKKNTPIVFSKEATTLEASHGVSWTRVSLLFLFNSSAVCFPIKKNPSG
ncbi:hypothetical protein MANES_09G165325v8 [Manihot esculenta]|uniref:Uncharacterized protein n=1 Tax=Manihot esculenta TaxID=3983 RepID=A0ACB7H6F5_MANES|nr:hypothetical protein MANES_09G165325v8 [Manihot esculenta]